ncbi:hypothetical protein ACFSYB_12090 [Litchfieldia salsa]
MNSKRFQVTSPGSLNGTVASEYGVLGDGKTAAFYNIKSHFTRLSF